MAQSTKTAEIPSDSETVYELGSITKLFTGILLAEAVNAGEVKLTDPIQAYLPTGIQAPIYKGIFPSRSSTWQPIAQGCRAI